MSQELSLSGTSSTSSNSNELALNAKYNKTLKIGAHSTVNELCNAIEECKKLLLGNDICSEERIWLVRHIVELRLRIQEMKDTENIPVKVSVSTMGHRFNTQVTAKTNPQQFCDHCGGIIWNIVQGSYTCEDCSFVCHFKCVDNIIRVCVHILLSETSALEMSICPQKGLGNQQYKCAECQTKLLVRGDNSVIEPRLCDYSGLFYCTKCHWNDRLPIPARVIHNWDWEEKPISRVAFQLLKLAYNRPMINIEKTNASVFNFVSELSWIHKMRKNLLIMQKYLNTCHSARKDENKLIRDIFSYTAAANHYSMSQLQAVNEGTLEKELSSLLQDARVHIVQCKQCSGKGYLCEMCGNSQIIFPFDSGAVSCTLCNSLFHRSCWTKKSQSCPKCKRIAERKIADEPSTDDDILLDNEIDEWMKTAEENI